MRCHLVVELRSSNAVNYLRKEARMRKGLLIALFLLGTVIAGSAQTSRKTSNPSQVTAGQIERIGDDTFFSRNVVIVLTDGSKITADTATFHTSSNTVDLTGSVRLTLKSEK
jgi:hypothetical protein